MPPQRHHPQQRSHSEKRALLEQLLRRAANPAAIRQPLTHGQQALWLTHQLAPHSWAYHMVFSARIRSAVDTAALQGALQILLTRHPALRTTYALHHDTPQQTIQPAPPVDFAVVESPTKSGAFIRELALSDSRHPFDLEHGPVMRARLFRHSTGDDLFVLTIHHIAIDFWGLGVLLRELGDFYSALRAGRANPLPPQNVSYSDYVQWQTAMVCSPEGERQSHYWQQQLAGDLPVLQLPLDRPRPPVQTDSGNAHPFRLTAPLTQALHTLAQNAQTTLYTVLLSALHILLHRYTGQDDILVGSPMAGRNTPRFRQLVGYCVNPVVLRGDLSGNPTCQTFLAQMRHTVLEALRHADYPFARLVEHLQPQRDISRPPLFQVSLALQTMVQQEALLAFFMSDTPASAPIHFGGLELEPDPLPQQEGQFELTFEMAEVRGALCGMLQYNTDLFDATTIARIARHFEAVLKAMVDNISQPLGTLPLLTKTERHQILIEWNQTNAAYPHDRCLHHLFEAQVKRTPAAIAAVCGSQRMTYSELNRHANQLAHFLLDIGIQPEALIGLYVERSIDMMVGLLGILKAGGAYVPLDPTYPAQRLTFLLHDSQIPVLLTQHCLLDRLPGHSAQVVCLDTDWPRIAPEPDTDPLLATHAHQLAYVIYTSGSTGHPKGTMIPHRGLVNYLTWCSQAYAVSAGNGAPVHSSLAFDLTITGLLAPLIVGQQVVLVPENLGIAGLYTTLHHHQDFSLVKITPAHLELLNQQVQPQEAKGLTHAFIIGGEALTPTHLAFWQQHAPSTRLINEYGPTETVVGCCVYDVPRDLPFAGSIPIGRPIANTQLYVLDRHLQPVPIGVSGELYIGGAGVARGYLNQPELTNAKFIRNPFSRDPNCRLYKTGDLARYLPDGNLDFLGRADDQIKFRGFRIELDEIATVLRQHPAVREATIVVRDRQLGDKRLVAYWVSDPHLSASVHDLRQALQERLPHYMVPSAFVRLESLPLTPNGKVDRRQLPAPESTAHHTDQAKTPPQSQTEIALAQLWGTTLGLETVGRYDNFFDLGGHSLLATRLMSRIQQTLQINLPLRQLFDTPTVTGLAQALDTSRELGPAALSAASPTIDWHAEATLAAAITPATVQPMATPQLALTPRAIFLTGGTGFLGAYLLHELLRHTQADIYCLVRAATPEQGQQRLRHNLARYALSPQGAEARIIPVIGDLAQPRLGLSPQPFDQLAADIDAIYHNGSTVNFIAPYAELKAANVLGTQDILQLASHIKVKPVHYISTISVFDRAGYAATTRIREQDPLHRDGNLFNGYAQSKWVAEHLVSQAGNRGLPISIYRPATISGHSQTGQANTADLACCLIKGCIQIESIPSVDIKLDWVPVDFVSQAIAHLSRQEQSIGKVFHLVNPQPLHLPQLAHILHAYGYPLAAEPYPAWQTKLQATAERGSDNALHPFLSLLTDKVTSSEFTVAELYSRDQRPQFDCRNTMAGLIETDITCPPIHHELIATYLNYLIQTQFLPLPPQPTKSNILHISDNYHRHMAGMLK